MAVYTASLQLHLARQALCAEVVTVRRLPEALRNLERRDPRPRAFIVSDVTRLERLRSEPVLRLRRDRHIQTAVSELALHARSPRFGG